MEHNFPMTYVNLFVKNGQTFKTLTHT